MAQSGAGGPTVRRMLVGVRLRRLRTDAGISREEAGEAIRASEWKIHRLENGQVGFKERDIVDLLRRYGVTDPGRDRRGGRHGAGGQPAGLVARLR
jgi:DNA-binding XRE family transcriptional regulator